MKRKAALSLPSSMLEKFDKIPMTRSGAISQALLNAGRDPALLSRAFQLRMSTDEEQNDARICYSRDTKHEQKIEKLSRLTRLSGEEVVRLCMEAYIYGL